MYIKFKSAGGVPRFTSSHFGSTWRMVHKWKFYSFIYILKHPWAKVLVVFYFVTNKMFGFSIFWSFTFDDWCLWVTIAYVHGCMQRRSMALQYMLFVKSYSICYHLNILVVCIKCQVFWHWCDGMNSLPVTPDHDEFALQQHWQAGLLGYVYH